MKYRENPKNGDKLSILGFGCLRLPKDDREVEKQLVYAIENGVNYFDTAYIYPGNEAALGRVLVKGCRGRVKLATKLPPYLVKNYEDLDKIFNTQLSRLQTDYFDYYLIHMLPDLHVWERLIRLGILKWINEKRENRQIVNLGFSYHGGRAEFVSLLDAYDWDFCMIQYNYLDENRQAGRAGLEYAAAKGLPVMIMEPLRGGKLVSELPKEAYAVWNSAYVKRSPAEWGLRYVWNHPGVSVVLSGMNSMDMIKENIRIASEAEANEFTEPDHDLFERVRVILESKKSVPCTGCGYCMPCPQGVDIPTCFSCYNDRWVEGNIGARKKYLMQTGMKAEALNASRCTACGCCEKHCPQNIRIREELKTVAGFMEGFYYKPVRFLIKKLMKF